MPARAWFHNSLAPFLVLRPFYAILLLLCIGRTLLPEAWLLAWHPHTHTTELAYRSGTPSAQHRHPLLSSRHQHCHAEQFYTVPFLLARPVELPAWQSPASYPRLTQLAVAGCPQPARPQPCLRGPPAQELVPQWLVNNCVAHTT